MKGKWEGEEGEGRGPQFSDCLYSTFAFVLELFLSTDYRYRYLQGTGIIEWPTLCAFVSV